MYYIVPDNTCKDYVPRGTVYLLIFLPFVFPGIKKPEINFSGFLF